MELSGQHHSPTT